MSLFRNRPRHPVAPQTEDRAFTLPSFPATSYAAVGDVTRGEVSLQSIAVRATADLIASLVSELPVTVYRNGKRVKGSTPANLDDPGADGAGREDWLYRLMMSWLLRGNAYGDVQAWGSSGQPTAVDLWHPDDVRVVDVSGEHQWYHKGKRLDGKPWHSRVNPMPGRLLGLSPVESHAATLGVSLSATQFGRQWFTEGAHPSGILANSEVGIDETQARTVKARFREAIHGTRDPLVLGKGWGWHSIQVSPEESQFLATINATEAQCARMFGPGFAEVMGYESGGSMTYANVVDRRQDLLVFSMGKWIRRADRVFTSLLPPSTLTVRLERDALLETTTLQRYQAHESALRSQWRTINEIRQIEDLEPVAWGDEPKTTTNNAPGVNSGTAAQS